MWMRRICFDQRLCLWEMSSLVASQRGKMWQSVRILRRHYSHHHLLLLLHLLLPELRWSKPRRRTPSLSWRTAWWFVNEGKTAVGWCEAAEIQFEEG